MSRRMSTLVVSMMYRIHSVMYSYRLRKSVLSKNFMLILAIRSKDDHLFARFGLAALNMH